MVLCCLFLLFFPAVLPAQIYTAGSGYYSRDPSVIFPWEASLGLTGVYAPVKEPAGDRLLRVQGGVSARFVYYLAPWVGVGLEGTWFFPASGQPLMDKYKVMRGGVVGKFVVSSETATRSYGLLSAGWNRREAVYFFGWREQKSSAYWAAGLGVETDVSDASFIGAEIRGIYNSSAQLGRFTCLESQWEAEASIRFGMRF